MAHMIDTAGKNFCQVKGRYRRDFVCGVRPSGEVIDPDNIVFLRKKHFGRSRQKILPVVDGPYRVKIIATMAVTVKMGDKLGRLSQR